MKIAPTISKYFACDCAEHVLKIFENRYPSDRRPCIAIIKARENIDGKPNNECLKFSNEARIAAGFAAWQAGHVLSIGDIEYAAAAWAAESAAWAAESVTKTPFAINGMAVICAVNYAAESIRVKDGDLAWYDERDWQKKRLQDLVWKALKLN